MRTEDGCLKEAVKLRVLLIEPYCKKQCKYRYNENYGYGVHDSIV